MNIVDEDINTNEANELAGIEAFARGEFAKSNANVQLGELVDVKRQVVAGMNYKMKFQTETGFVEITVFDQPWTSTRTVTDVSTTEKKEHK